MKRKILQSVFFFVLLAAAVRSGWAGSEPLTKGEHGYRPVITLEEARERAVEAAAARKDAPQPRDADEGPGRQTYLTENQDDEKESEQKEKQDEEGIDPAVEGNEPVEASAAEAPPASPD